MAEIEKVLVQDLPDIRQRFMRDVQTCVRCFMKDCSPAVS